MEIIPIVDKSNNLIGKEERSIVHENGIFHRAVNVILFSPNGEILLQKRSTNKLIYPLYWDLSVAEHVKPKESYLNAAKRGLKEELGIDGLKLTKLRGVHLQKTEYNKLKDYEFSELYCANFDGKIKIDTDEVADARFFTFDDVNKFEKDKKLTPWFAEEWKWM